MILCNLSEFFAKAVEGKWKVRAPASLRAPNFLIIEYRRTVGKLYYLVTIPLLFSCFWMPFTAIYLQLRNQKEEGRG